MTSFDSIDERKVLMTLSSILFRDKPTDNAFTHQVQNISC